MTARKRIISVISIITLVLAITAGIALSAVVGAGNNKYVGENITLSNTDVTIDAQTSAKSDDSYPEDAVEIADAEGLQSFIKDKSDAYGILTADITLDWAGVGAQAYLAKGRTIDGNGHTVTLADAQATASVNNSMADNAELSGSAGVVQGFQGEFPGDGLNDPVDNGSNVAKRNYGLFVDFNFGTIKNIKFVYNQASHLSLIHI